MSNSEKKEVKKRVATGVTTSDLVMSAYTLNNEDIFPNILSLYVPEGSSIADVTYGKGVFWKKVDQEKYDLHFSDIKTGIDCRNLPYEDSSMDCVVIDPPYMEGFYRKSSSLLQRLFDRRADGGVSSRGRDFCDAGKPRTLRRPHRKAAIQNGRRAFDAASHGRSDKRNRGRKPQPTSRYVRAGSKKPEGKHHLGRCGGFPKG